MLTCSLTYTLPDPASSEDRRASCPQASALKPSSLAPAYLTHEFKRCCGISAHWALLHAGIPPPVHARTPNLSFLLDVN